MDEEDDLLKLCARYAAGFTVQCYANEAVDPDGDDDDDSRPVDDTLMVDIDYRNCNDGSADNNFFMMKMINFDDESLSERCRSNVVGWVEELGVDRREPVFEATVEVVVYSIKQLVDEVRHKGRKTLCMSVDIEVSDPQEEEEEEEDVEMEEEEKHYETAKGVLEASGVRFVKVNTSSGVVNGGCCPICLDEFEDQEEVAMLPCSSSHVLHLGCLLPWIACGGLNCPLCRADVLAPEFMEC